MAEQEYTLEKQQLLLGWLVSDPDSFVRCRNILEPKYFDIDLVPAVQFILKYVDEHSSVPAIETIDAETGVQLKKIHTTEGDKDYFFKNLEKFCKHKALENAILTSYDLLKTEKYGDIERLIKDAVLVSLQKDLGLLYWDNPVERINRMRDRSNRVATGWKTIDKKLYGGFDRGTINVFCGASGTGKSLFLQNYALNQALAEEPLNVVIITLELSEELTAFRIDAMLTRTPTTDIIRDIDTIGHKVALAGKGRGRIQIKYMPAGATTNDIKTYLKEYQIKTGIKPDILIVDYLDLVHPNNKNINPSDMFIKDKYVSEELRALGTDMGMIVVTASQLNRSATDEQEHNHSHIAGGISKINTADNVISIFQTHAMRDRGEYRIQFLKARTASCTGDKVNLAYDNTCMRIEDMPDDNVNMYATVTDAATKAKRIQDSLKQTDTKSDESAKEETSFSPSKEINMQERSSRLKDMLDRLKKN